MRGSNIAVRISGISILALAIWAAYKMGTQKTNDIMLKIPLADQIKFAAEQERYKQRAPLGLVDLLGTDEESLQRYDPYDRTTRTNVVRGWPSTGGIIIAERAHAVELQFLDIDRFGATPRSSDPDREDAFCRKLRLIGAKWWIHNGDYDRARIFGLRSLYPDEAEVLLLGWPEGGGVWVSRYQKLGDTGSVDGMKILDNALSMEDRSRAIELIGGTFFVKAEDSDFVKPFVDGFGEHEKRRKLERYEAV